MLRGTRVVYHLVFLISLSIGYVHTFPLQVLPSIPGYIPVYIRHGDQPLEEINPALAEAFHEGSRLSKVTPLTVEENNYDTNPSLPEASDNSDRKNNEAPFNTVTEMSRIIDDKADQPNLRPIEFSQPSSDGEISKLRSTNEELPNKEQDIANTLSNTSEEPLQLDNERTQV